jgi:hypothetical protein
VVAEKQPYTEIQAKADELRFLGEPTGDGLSLLKSELTKILMAEGNTARAYLSRVRYPGEERIRVALVLDGKAPARKMAEVIARECQPLVAIDLLFFETLTPELIASVQKDIVPFFVTRDA